MQFDPTAAGKNVQMDSDIRQRILDAVDVLFDAQLATTCDLVAIPSTRGAEGPCQDMIGDLLRERSFERPIQSSAPSVVLSGVLMS
jgi:acetylornithine deacetylase/succinyl-diaminopimelate desuccinylase-like protein